MTHTGSEMTDGRLLTRVLVLVGGVIAATVVGWLAGDVSARADVPVVDEASEWIAPMTAVEIDLPETATPAWSGGPLSAVTSPSLPVPAVLSAAGNSKSVLSLVERAVLSVEKLDGVAKSMANVVTAADGAARHAVTALDASDPRWPGEVSRDLMEVSASVAGPPVSNSVTTSSAPDFRGAADGRTALSAPCRDNSPGEPAFSASRARTSGHTAGKSSPPWSPMSLCGTSTSLAVACGGDHGSGAVLSGRPARADRMSPDRGDDGHRAALAVVRRPDVTPG
ncbi:MAG TPA: hypothetical protein VFG15_01275 [Amycolatopsis sp.]|nr:hypothetical protein [Amycolatopsis sp.]